MPERPKLPVGLSGHARRSDGLDWLSRQCVLVRKPIIELTSKSTTEIPFSIPELQLFYKAGDPRPKDELDFAAAFPLLNASQIAWLTTDCLQDPGSFEAIWDCRNAGHPVNDLGTPSGRLSAIARGGGL